jgi:hypothetical protein
MSIFRILLYAFLIYLAYKIVFDLIIPVYRTTKQVKKGFKEMNERMNDYRNQQSPQPAQPEQPKKSTDKSGDYIEYEEIK